MDSNRDLRGEEIESEVAVTQRKKREECILAVYKRKMNR